MTVANFFLITIKVLLMGVFIRANTLSKIEELISQWAPVVWLAPGDKYLPLSVEEFLTHVQVAQQPSPLFDEEAQIPYGPGSENFYFVTKNHLGDLLNDSNSFIHGRNPTSHSIPVYTIVTPCSPNLSFHTAKLNSMSDTVNAFYTKVEPNPHFHVVYWMFFPYNEGKEICLIGKVPTPILFGSCIGQRKIMGNHVGDWEHMSLSFNGNAYPDTMHLSVHDAGVYYKYDVKSKLFKYVKQVTKKGILQRPKFPKTTKTQNYHPILFSAKGSHGLWSAPGDHYFVKVPRLSDENGYGTVWETWRNLKIYYLGITTVPSWMKYKGKWGNPQSNCLISKKLGLCEVSDGPTDEAPSGPPTSIRVDGSDQHSLKVYWKPPVPSDWNGEILGYYVGYKLASSEKPYLFETVESVREEGKEYHLVVTNLKTYTPYSIVVQAFNKVGAGPMSEEIKVYTPEGTPEQPPHDTTCTTLTAQTMYVSWTPPPLSSANGIIKGYKVIYGPSDSWYDESTKDTKITDSSRATLHFLKKYTNYTIQVLAYSSGGDGVRSNPIHCQTEQDVPEAPVAIKALVMSTTSILISWKPPQEPNGIVEQYTVYVREAGLAETEGINSESTPKAQKIVPNTKNQNLSFQAKDLDNKLKYEFWVTASTNIGEGQASKIVVMAPSARVPAKIASFDDTFVTIHKEDVTLPCLTVGVPQPVIIWKIKGITFTSSDHIRQQPDGSLMLRDVTQTDAGEYYCHVENSFGQDSVTHQLIVNSPPHSPQVTLTSTTTSSLTVKIKPNTDDTEPIYGYTIRYKPEFGNWETIQIDNQTQKYTLENLLCGTGYQVQVTAYNSIGTGEASDNLNTRTRGDKPGIPSANKFIEVLSNSVVLHLDAWSDGSCPMLYFAIEQKKKTSSEWIQVANNVKPRGNFLISELDPAIWYHLRVTAHNNAGTNVGEYEFATLTLS